MSAEILETARLEEQGRSFEQVIVPYLDDLLPRKEIRSIGVGVPGVVEGDCYWRNDEESGELCRVELGERLIRRYGLPVVMENDINAAAVGFGRRYAAEFPDEGSGGADIAYLYFEKGCVGAGFLTGGRIIRGCHNFAGEIGLIPQEDGRPLHESVSSAGDSDKYAGLVLRTVCWIIGILNPRCIALGGPDFRKDCIGIIERGLPGLLPERMPARVVAAPDVWRDYYEGMACLTAEKMIDEVQFI